MKKTAQNLYSSIPALFYLLTCLLVSHFAIAADNDARRPHEHLCPITLQRMTDPVVAADGHSYERKAIEAYFARNSGNPNPDSPITQRPLAHKELTPNQALKIMIDNWKSSGQLGPSELDTRSAEEIARRVREEFDRNAHVFNSAKDQHIVVFLGNTGAGKSTLINLLAGKELVTGPYENDYVLADPEDQFAMAIGTGGNSETLYPKSIDVKGLRFFDLPGFNDTDGSERNLVNAAFIRQILTDAASVRLVFVAGQDQFTADRSASVKQMFNCIKQLFVVSPNVSLIDNAVFVATKVAGNTKGELAPFLLHKTNTKDKHELSAQLELWSRQNRLCCMYSPPRDDNNAGVKEQILGLIEATPPTKVIGINVSVLYPPDTKEPLERMFYNVLEGVLLVKFNKNLTTISDYDNSIGFYTSNHYWQAFDADVCQNEHAIGLLKQFCINQYNKAFGNVQKANEGRRQAYIQSLRDRRQQRVRDIEQRTDQRATEVITSLVPKKEGDELVPFDFSYHKDCHAQVCGQENIERLATDPAEQNVVRQYYAGFISEHAHKQMLSWYKKFSGFEGLVREIAALKEKVSALEENAAEKAVEDEEEEDLKPENAPAKKSEEQKTAVKENAPTIHLPVSDKAAAPPPAAVAEAAKS